MQRGLSTAFQGPLIRSIGVLAGGTAAAHAISALAMPISTRLFSPADFTVAASFSSLLGILIAASCLRFELAIPLPEAKEEAADLLALSAASAATLAGLLALMVALAGLMWPSLIHETALGPYLSLLAPAVLISGLYLALQMWFVRARQFASVARSRVAQSAVAGTAQISLGALGHAPIGLIIGQILNYGAGAFILGSQALLRDGALLREVRPSRMAAAFRKHHRFPRFSVWEALANAGSIHLPMLLIAALAVGPEAGYLTLAMFLLQVPMSLLGSSVAQVYLSGAPQAHREGRIGAYTAEIVGGLLRAAAGPMLFLAIASPAAFGLLFGADWTRSGILVAWMVPWFWMQFLSSPVSTALHVTDRQKTAMILQIGGLVLRAGAVFIALVAAPGVVAEVYAVSGFVFYAIYMAVVMHSVELRVADLRVPLRKSLFPAIAGLAAGALAVPLFGWANQAIVGYEATAPQASH